MKQMNGFTNTGHTAMHPVKIDLTPDEILQYGQQYAHNMRRVLPDIKTRHDDAIEPLEERLRQLDQEKEFLISQLAAQPGEDGYVSPTEKPEAETARELARILSEISGVENQIRSLKLEYKVGVNKVELDSELLRMRINLQYEMRDVPCAWWVNWTTGLKRLVRIDTQEIVLERALSPEERQLSLLDVEITSDMLSGMTVEVEG